MATAVEDHFALLERVRPARVLGRAGFELAAELLEPERLLLDAGHGGRALPPRRGELLALAPQLLLEPSSVGREPLRLGGQRGLALGETTLQLVLVPPPLGRCALRVGGQRLSRSASLRCSSFSTPRSRSAQLATAPFACTRR